MPRVLLLATTTGYQTRAFGEAAERLGVDLVFATDRCDVLEDPWQDRAVPIRFSDDSASARAIFELARTSPLDGVLAVGDRPTVIASLVQEGLGLPGHPAAAAAAARNKLLTRERLSALAPRNHWCRPVSLAMDPRELAASVSFPCVLKPLALSGSRGVMRVDDEIELVAAFRRLRALLDAPDLRGEPKETRDVALVEGFVEGREFALEGLMNHGTLHPLAIFDKPDPLDGPFFEETIYVTPSAASHDAQRAMTAAVDQAACALGLRHGPLHAECRVSGTGVFVLEVAPRPIGGLCARALRFVRNGDGDIFPDSVQEKYPRPHFGPAIPLEELLLRHALGESSKGWRRETAASGVMMIPIPRRGIFRGVTGLDAAGRVPFIDDLQITAKADQLLLPLPEGSSYLGFIFARAGTAAQVEQALREAHARLEFAIDPELRVLQSAHG
jgi:ATP-grasp domain/L-amino acid ligase C-terminal domain 2/ATP-grasp N-terminal domain